MCLVRSGVREDRDLLARVVVSKRSAGLSGVLRGVGTWCCRGYVVCHVTLSWSGTVV